MKRDILLVSTARESSSRCKEKMIKPFSDTTLFDIHMNTLEEIQEKNDNIFDDIIICVSDIDKNLWKKAHEYNIKIQERDMFSATVATKMSDIFEFLNFYDQNYFMWLNASCPFMKADTILSIGKYFKENDMESLHAIKKCMNWLWEVGSNKPFNIKDDITETQSVIPIYESLHSYHIHNRKYILENNTMWSFTQNDPYLYIIEDESIEYYDIDNEINFKVAEELWKKRV